MWGRLKEEQHPHWGSIGIPGPWIKIDKISIPTGKISFQSTIGYPASYSMHPLNDVVLVESEKRPKDEWEPASSRTGWRYFPGETPMWGRLKHARDGNACLLGIPGPWMAVQYIELFDSLGEGRYLVNLDSPGGNVVPFFSQLLELSNSECCPEDPYWGYEHGWYRKNNKKEEDQMEKPAGQRELRKRMLETTVGSALLPLMMLIARNLGINTNREGDWKGDNAFIHELQQENLSDRHSLVLSGVMETLLTFYSAGTKENPRGEAQRLKDLLDKEIAAKWDATMAKLAAEEESAKLERERVKTSQAEQEAKTRFWNEQHLISDPDTKAKKNDVVNNIRWALEEASSACASVRSLQNSLRVIQDVLDKQTEEE